ncbi:hypothetical protein EON65_09580 [archaeon]|nr:MAG: hypothetical protein EON65_09580 [archaeon]
MERRKSGKINNNETHAWSVELAYGCALFRRGAMTTCQINGAHSALPVGIDFDQRHVVGFFRDPKKRIVSSFLDSRHHEGMPAEDYANMLSAMNNVSRMHKSDAEVTVELASIYVHQPDMLGCQVKMLIGHECSAPLFNNKPFDTTALSLAIERLRRFNFVGITDYFELSVQLFHRMAGHLTVPSPIEFYVARATKEDDKALLLQNLSYHDPYDSALYEEALRIFKSNLKKFHFAHLIHNVTAFSTF